MFTAPELYPCLRDEQSDDDPGSLDPHDVMARDALFELSPEGDRAKEVLKKHLKRKHSKVGYYNVLSLCYCNFKVEFVIFDHRLIYILVYLQIHI